MKRIRPFILLLAAAFIFQSCSDDDADNDVTPNEFNEGEWVRIVGLSGGNQVMVMDPVGEKTAYTIEGEMPEGARFYTSPMGRYLVMIDRSNGTTRFFDTGIVNHSDHGHSYEAKWLGTALSTSAPTHFSGIGEHMVIFNDGDGSILYVNESRLEFDGYQPTSIPVSTQHHGAAVRLANGNFAVTFKDPEVTDTTLPQMVRLIDEEGALVHDEKGVRVTKIHGNASNGKVGAFGSAEGVILASQDKKITLVPNIEGLSAESGQWIGTLRGHQNLNVFYGLARDVGIFRIDPADQSMTAFYEGGDVASYFLSDGGKYLVVRKKDGEVMVFDAAAGKESAKASLSMARVSRDTGNGRVGKAGEIATLRAMEEPDQVLTTSSEYLYVLESSQTEINVYRLSDLKKIKTIQSDNTLDYITRAGFNEQ